MDQSIYGTAQFKVKFRETELRVAPGATASSLGTLKKGAVVNVIGQEGLYYYRVRLDNGLEGYVYKPAGVLTNGASLTPMASVQTESNGTGNGNGAIPSTTSANGKSATVGRPVAARNGSNGNGPALRPENKNMRTVSGGRPLVITSAEIAVFDKPGIVGKQLSKLKRGDEVMMVAQDSFFFQVVLPNGATGFIPRYSAETR